VIFDIFLDGTVRPTRDKKNPKFGQRWPKEQKNGDRVEDQLMFVPSNYRYDDEPMKKILLYNGLSNWMVDDGQAVFISKQCPVNRCKITTKKSEAPDVDAILFRDHFSHPGHKKTGKQVRQSTLFKFQINMKIEYFVHFKRTGRKFSLFYFFFTIMTIGNMLKSDPLDSQRR